MPVALGRGCDTNNGGVTAEQAAERASELAVIESRAGSDGPPRRLNKRATEQIRDPNTSAFARCVEFLRFSVSIVVELIESHGSSFVPVEVHNLMDRSFVIDIDLRISF
ncbi:hypothetical protein Dimus_021954 [Dionaea muscipula]